MDSYKIGHLIIRADSGPRIGTGHVMRCLALAQRWQACGGRCTFLSRCESEALRSWIESAGFNFVPLSGSHPDSSDLRKTLLLLGQLSSLNPNAPLWLILDGYYFDPAYQQAIRTAGHRLLVIDDNAHLKHYCADVLLNQNIHAERLDYCCDPDTLLLLGTRYVLLRNEFLTRQKSQTDVPEVARKILITLGGSDPDNVTLKIVHSLLRIEQPDLQFRVVVGPASPHFESLQKSVDPANCNLRILTSVKDMPGLMAWADVTLSAGGSTCWELAFMGVPVLAVVLAENQREIVKYLSELGVVADLDCISQEPEQTLSRLLSLIHNQGQRSRMSRLGRALVDGRGSERVVDFLTPKDSGERDLRLRAADPSDASLIWQWANDPIARANSFHPETIPWEAHLDWYALKLGSNDTRIWVLEYRRVPAGQIRYDRTSSDVAQISFTVAPHYRGRGLGTKLLEMSAEMARFELPAKWIEGITFADNSASNRAFLKAGFKQVARKKILGKECLVFRQPCFQAHPEELSE